MEKYAELIKLNQIINDLEENGFYDEADELHEYYLKLAAKKPWYKSPLVVAPAIMGTMLGPGRNILDKIQNRELYQATQNMEDYTLREKSEVILLWKKFLNSMKKDEYSFLPMNGVWDNIVQIRTEEFAKENNLPSTPGRLDRELFEATYKAFPNNPILNQILKILPTAKTTLKELPSEFSIDLASQSEDPALRMKAQQMLSQLEAKQTEKQTPKTIRKPIRKHTVKIKKPEYGVQESAKQGIPWGTSDADVYKIYRKIRNKYEGRSSTDPHDTGNLNPNRVPGGGGTKYGITQRNWDGYCMRNKMPLSPVLKITREQAEKVGFEDYKRSGAQILPPNTQIAVADFHFNGGPGNMIIVLRDILKLPPIRVQGLKRDAMVEMIKEQKKVLYPMIKEMITNQEEDENFARAIYSGRVKLLAGSKTKRKTKQLVHNRGLLDRIDEMAEVTGNETILDDISEQMKNLSPKKRLQLLKKYRLNRSRYYLPGYGNTAYDANIRKQFEDKS